MKFSIDSCCIRLPLNEVKILDSKIEALLITIVEDTGEIVRTEMSNRIVREDRGIKSKFSIEIQYNIRNFREEHLVITINSKMLKRRYFEGLTLDNISEVHKYLMEQEAVSFSLETMLTAQVVDIDFKRDFTAKRESVVKALKVMYDNAKPQIEVNKGALKFGLNKGYSGDNIGLQFNRRETTSISTAPFMKIYNKTGDLITKSNIFALEHLEEIPNDLWRTEFTIKNKKHLAMYKMSNTLGGLLNTPQEAIQEAYNSTLRAVMNKRLREAVHSGLISPNDLLQVNSMIINLDCGYTWGILKENLLGTLQGSNRTKKSQRLEELFNAYIKPIKKYSNYQNLDNVLAEIGYTF
jgi:hypothetical protein